MFCVIGMLRAEPGEEISIANGLVRQHVPKIAQHIGKIGSRFNHAIYVT